MVNVIVKQIIGRAGTGKTTYAKRVAAHHLKHNKTVYCLSLTHSAVQNMRDRGFPSGCIFSTLHSFFRIDFTGEVIGCYLPFNVLIIDEFSLISSNLLDKCIRSIFKAGNGYGTECEVYLVGDPLQLGSINGNNSIEYTLLDKAFNALPIKELPVNMIVPIIRHWGSLCINSPLITELTERSKILTNNYRSNDTIMKLVEEIIFKGNLLEIIPLLRPSDDIVKLVRDHGYTVISSTYNTLKIINDRVRTEKNALTYHDWKYMPNERVYMTINTNALYNGEMVTILTADDTSITIDSHNGKNIITDLYIRNIDGITVNDKIPIAIPSYLYSFHKSQGLEFDNVAICIDNLFEFSMLYTGITRAKKNVVFFTMNSMIYNELEKLTGFSVKFSALNELHDKLAQNEIMAQNTCDILRNYVNTGTVELNAINNIYTDISDK